MAAARVEHAVAVLDGKLYAAGGLGGCRLQRPQLARALSSSAPCRGGVYASGGAAAGTS